MQSEIKNVDCRERTTTCALCHSAKAEGQVIKGKVSKDLRTGQLAQTFTLVASLKAPLHLTCLPSGCVWNHSSRCAVSKPGDSCWDVSLLTNLPNMLFFFSKAQKNIMRGKSFSSSQRETNPHNHPLTSAPLLSRIMKMMNDSNQLCSTIIKHVFLSVHQLLYFAPSSLIWQHWNLRTQPAGMGAKRENMLSFSLHTHKFLYCALKRLDVNIQSSYFKVCTCERLKWYLQY